VPDDAPLREPREPDDEPFDDEPFDEPDEPPDPDALPDPDESDDPVEPEGAGVLLPAAERLSVR